MHSYCTRAVVEPAHIKLFSEGSFGRGHLKGKDWFKANAVYIYLGALETPDGRGSRAIHQGDDGELTIAVQAPRRGRRPHRIGSGGPT